MVNLGMGSKEKRSFRRYPKISDFDLKINNKSFKAKITDYSLDGLGAVVEDSPPIKKGDVIDLTINEPEIKIDGEIVWAKRDQLGLRIGVRNIGGLKGLIKDFGLADTLIGLQRSNKTGILTVQFADVVKKVYIRNGDMIFSASNQDEDRLGDVLLKEGRITKEQYDLSVIEMEKSKQRHGAELVKLGYLKPQELVTAVRHHAENIIMSLFTFEDGSFSFEEIQLPTEEVITLKLSAANLIYSGIKKIKSLHRIESELPGMESILCFSPDPFNLFQDVRLDSSGKKVISCIDGKTTINDILSITQLDRLDTLKTIYALLIIRMLEEKSPDEPFAEMPEAVIKEIFEEEDEINARQKMKPETDPMIRNMIEDMHQKYDGLGYYGVLGVKDYATIGEIKSAYYKVAKQFHPDMHFHLADDSLKGKLSDIFSYIYDAYATLSNPERKKEYDRMISLKPARLTSNQDKAKALFNEGKVELKRNKYQEAELLFGQAKYFDSTMSEYHYYYGIALMKQEKFKLAEKALERALKLEPANANYLADLGFVFLNLGFPTRARAFFEKALKISPDNARACEGMTSIKK